MKRTSPAPVRSRRPEERRDDLLDAADGLFREKGVASTTVSEITQRAGVAKGTYYLYFDSKDHVVAGLHERLCDGMAGLVLGALHRLDTGGFLPVVDELVAAIIDHWISHRATFIAIYASGQSPETIQLLAEYDERIISMLEAGIRTGAEQGVVAAEDSYTAAQFLFYGCRGATTSALLAPGPIDRDRLVAGSQAIVRKVLHT